jgi:hypothetical protein
MVTVIEAVPVAGFAVNFSSMPRSAPPPLGRDIAGADVPLPVVVQSARCCHYYRSLAADLQSYQQQHSALGRWKHP